MRTDPAWLMVLLTSRVLPRGRGRRREGISSPRRAQRGPSSARGRARASPLPISIVWLITSTHLAPPQNPLATDHGSRAPPCIISKHGARRPLFGPSGARTVIPAQPKGHWTGPQQICDLGYLQVFVTLTRGGLWGFCSLDPNHFSCTF